MGFNLKGAVDHADSFWHVPCADGLVVTHAKMINIKAEMKKRKLKESDFEAVFLNYKVPGGQAEGLFFISKSFSNLQSRINSDFSVDSVPDPRHFVCSFRDAGKDVAIGQTPEYTGLNDCAHFVSECLGKSKINVADTNAEKLFKKLQSLGANTKTLAKHVDKEKARRIINSRILQPGDVILFATPKLSHLHSTLYLGSQQVAAHTHINHSQAKGDQQTDPQTQKKNNWEISSNTSHPLVTLIHFTRDGEPPATSGIIGTWKASRPGKEFVYKFDKNGSASATSTKAPAALRGFWFQDAFGVSVCWSANGDFETYPLTTPLQKSVAGTLNGDERVTLNR